MTDYSVVCVASCHEPLLSETPSRPPAGLLRACTSHSQLADLHRNLIMRDIASNLPEDIILLISYFAKIEDVLALKQASFSFLRISFTANNLSSLDV